MLSTETPFRTLICDIGDVLFTWSTQTTTSIPAPTLKAIMSCPTWYEYERGRYDQDQCYEILAQEFPYSKPEIARALDQARESLTGNIDMIACFEELKVQSDGRLRLLAMSNISRPDYEVLRTKPVNWSIFDGVYTSAEANVRKPHIQFFRHVIQDAGIDPRSTIYIDDKAENVLSARSLGMHGIVFDDQQKVKRALRNLLGDPVQRGSDFLRQNASRLISATEDGTLVRDNYSQFLILEIMNDQSLVDLPAIRGRTSKFFSEEPILATEEVPFDIDTTALALIVTQLDEATVPAALEDILNYVSCDGIVQTYFDKMRPRFDPVVCVNALRAFSKYGREKELSNTFDWIRSVLKNNAHLDGTRHYPSPEHFLYFLYLLLEQSNDDADSAHAYEALKYLLRERVQERIGASGDPLALALRVLTCARLGIRDDVDLQKLLALQSEDGGWEMGWMYEYPASPPLRIGNRGLTTAVAVKAVEAMTELKSRTKLTSSIDSGTLQTEPSSFSPSPTQDGELKCVEKGPSPSMLSQARRRLFLWLRNPGRIPL